MTFTNIEVLEHAGETTNLTSPRSFPKFTGEEIETIIVEPAVTTPHPDNQIEPQLLAMHSDAFEKGGLPGGWLTLFDATNRWNRATETLRRAYEKRFTQSEYFIASICLSALRLMEKSLHQVRVADESTNLSTSQEVPVRVLRNKTGMLVLALKVVLYGSLVCAVASSMAQILILPLIGICVFLDAATWWAFHPGPTGHENTPARSKCNLEVDTNALELESRNIVQQIESALRLNIAQASEISNLREVAKARSRHSEVPESTSVFQKLYGLAARHHPDLRTLLQEQCVGMLELQELVFISHRQVPVLDEYFDVQASIDSTQTDVIELYPAVVKASNQSIVLRGRLIQPA